MKRCILFILLLATFTSCKKLYNCSCNETTTYNYIAGEPTSHNATSYIKKANKKKFAKECNSHEVFFQDSTKTITTDCSIEEE